MRNIVVIFFMMNACSLSTPEPETGEWWLSSWMICSETHNHKWKTGQRHSVYHSLREGFPSGPFGVDFRCYNGFHLPTSLEIIPCLSSHIRSHFHWGWFERSVKHYWHLCSWLLGSLKGLMLYDYFQLRGNIQGVRSISILKLPTVRYDLQRIS